MEESHCAICGNTKAESCLVTGEYSEIWNCPDCGKYILPMHVAHEIAYDFNYEKTHGDKSHAHVCAAVMLERNLKGLNTDVRLDYKKGKGLFIAGTNIRLESCYPITFYEKLERGFFNIIRSLRFSPLMAFDFNKLEHNHRNLLFIDDSWSNPEIVLNEYLCEEGWLRREGKEEKRYRVTTKGMQHFETASEKGNRAFAFLAMWFAVPGHEQYRNSVAKAAANAGYQLHIVDEQHYNGFIMDKVVNLINDSSFVIADISARKEFITDEGNVFGGVRGGVYWEAGYAVGQKKQVILTCDSDCETHRRIHFDLQQFNQIRWKVDGDVIMTVDGRSFEDVLTQRILATVGRGSFARGQMV